MDFVRRIFIQIFVTLFFGSSFLAYAAIVQKDSLWKNKKHLRVCFAESVHDLANTAVSLQSNGDGKPEHLKTLKVVPLREDLRVLLQKAVTDSFTVTKTGIDFVGFKSCKEAPADVVVFYVMDDYNVLRDGQRYFTSGEIGMPPGGLKNSIRLNDSKIKGALSEMLPANLDQLIKWSFGDEDKFKINWENFAKYAVIKDALHEFGHVAGLVHEHEQFSNDELKKWDLNVTHSELGSLIEENNRVREITKFAKVLEKRTGVPLQVQQTYGKINPISTMNYFHNYFDALAEQNRLICEFLKLPDIAVADWKAGNEEWREMYLKGIYKNLTQSDGIEYTHEKLKPYLCGDSDLELLSLKYQFERGLLLDHQDQSALKSAYTAAKFEDLDDLELRMIEYITKHWVPMRSFSW